MKKAGLSALVLGTGHQYARALSAFERPALPLSILHTNDLHGHFSSAPEHSTLPYWSQLIANIRSNSNPYSLLFDAGDHFGSPFSNHQDTVQAMNALGYDAICMGNNDMKMGIFNLLKQYEHVNFPVLSSNYSLINTELQSRIQPYTIVDRPGLRIGIFALNNSYKQLINNQLNPYIAFGDALSAARHTVDTLRRQSGCQFIVCLSHLGLAATTEEDSDLKLAQQVPGIDLILGGGSHTFMSEAIEIQNIINKKVIISHAGHDGLLLGKLDLEIHPDHGVRLLQSQYLNTSACTFL